MVWMLDWWDTGQVHTATQLSDSLHVDVTSVGSVVVFPSPELLWRLR